MSVQSWRKEGARSGDPQDICPKCGRAGIEFAADVKKFGHHTIRVCLACATVTADDESHPIEVFKPPAV